ncbi:MAG: tetraacyldisaccharide 4'-kinase, partial [Bacteroidales bacterium]|nr:tetraacyldisaccharide 4'-kinase [Bacteroidales bacterium]
NAMNSDKIILAPYYWALRLRHFLYNKGIKKSQRAPVPTICVGNLAVGGTGKTPFTEMLLRLLSSSAETAAPESRECKVGVLSKGYGRKSKGFLYVEPDEKMTVLGASAKKRLSAAEKYGDEPLQIKRKFPSVPVAVCSSRIEGCRQMAQDGCERIILDDAFQHRALQADLNIVLIEYNRPLAKDHLLPLGRLRDIPERIHAADIIIASKCPEYLSEEEKAAWIQSLRLRPDEDKPVFFTHLAYATPCPVFDEGDKHYLYAQKMIVVSGIANDRPMVGYLSGQYQMSAHLRFPDHHAFTASDLKSMEKAAAKTPNAIILTTEKDSQRLRPLRDKLSSNVCQRLFYLPIETKFLTPEDEEKFIHQLLF